MGASEGWMITRVLSPAERELGVPYRERPGRGPLDRGALQHYSVVREISSGGFGTVFSAKDRRNGRQVAIKVLRSELAGSEYVRNLFYREIYAVRLIHHPNIVEIH